MPQNGSPAYNPSGAPTAVDTNTLSYGATTLAVAANAGTTSLTLTAAVAAFQNNDILILDNGTPNAEIVMVLSGGGTTALTLVDPIKFSHAATTGTVANLGSRQIVSLGDPNTPANQLSIEPPGTSGAFAVPVQGVAGAVPVPVVIGSGDVQSGTYFASYTALAGIAGIVVLLGGSASKIVRLRKVFISGVATTASIVDITFVKYNTAATGGTAATAAVLGTMDSTNPAATATLAAYTAAPTAGTSGGIITAVKTAIISSTVGSAQPSQMQFPFSAENDQAPTLRGVAQQIGLVLSAALTGGSLDVTFWWTESAV